MIGEGNELVAVEFGGGWIWAIDRAVGERLIVDRTVYASAAEAVAAGRAVHS